MKTLVASVLLIWASICSADEFNLEFTARNYIIHHPEDWTLVSEEPHFNLFVNQTAVGTNKDTIPVFSVVHFNNPNGFKYDLIEEPVQRIYTFGIIECGTGIFNLLNSWYVDKANYIVYTQANQIDTYLVEMKTPNTSRNDLFVLVCPGY